MQWVEQLGLIRGRLESLGTQFVELPPVPWGRPGECQLEIEDPSGRKQLEQDPMTGCAFVFRNRKGTAIKILLYDGQGYWLCQKRLSSGRFLHWPSGHSPTRSLQAHQPQVLLAVGNADSADGAPVCAPASCAPYEHADEAVTKPRRSRRYRPT